MRSYRVSVLCLLLLAGLVSVASGAVILDLEFRQIIHEIDEETGPGAPDDVGSLMVVYDKGPDVEFLNVAAVVPGLTPDPVWLVRNMPLYSLEMGPPSAETAVRLPLSWLGVEYGVAAPPIHYGWQTTPTPLDETDGLLWAASAALPEIRPFLLQVHDAKGRDPALPDAVHTWPDPDGGWHEPFSPLAASLVTWSTIGCAMPNIPLNRNARPLDGSGCAAASTTNSLLWLRGKHEEINFPGDEQKIFKQLSDLMNRMAGEGVTNDEMARAKLDFIEAHGLPIKVKVQNYETDGDIASSSGRTKAADSDGGPLGTWPTHDWICSETRDNEDVEINFGYYYKDAAGKWKCADGHSVVLTGAGKVLGAPYIDVKHDKNQGTDSGTEEERCWLTTAPNGAQEISGWGGKWKHKGDPSGTVYEHHAFIDGVISESLDKNAPQPPSSETFGGYCQEFVRVIPPGKTLEMDFPESNFWGRAVTVYTRDRSADPPRDVKHVEWSDNEGKTRRIANTDSIKTLTVVVHCDDRQPWRPGYSPWSVGLRMVDNSGKSLAGSTTNSTIKSTTPGNPDEYGGFSMGWSDSSNAEFGSITAPVVMVATDQGADLRLVPGWLGVSGGCQDLVLTRQIPVWNPYWEQLGFIVDVAEVGQAGDLFVECMQTGTAETIAVGAPGRYEILLGGMAPSPEFSLRLAPLNGLEMALDCVGVPSMVDGLSGTDLPPALPERPLIRAVHPNPFNPAASVRFALPRAATVELQVYDLQGRHVATVFRGPLAAGEHVRVWRGRGDDGRDAAAGTYLMLLRADGVTASAKAMLVR